MIFNELRKANVGRCKGSFHGVGRWSPSDWSNAMAGECGEVCNLTKKLRRGENIPSEMIADEIADVIIYADLLAARLKINLDSAVKRKFNIVSKRVGSKIFL